MALILSAWATCSHAAGGHFAVDDASILDGGQCQLETWVEREGSTRSLVHAGPACRLGLLEIGVNADRSQLRDGGPVTIVGPQVKWASAVNDRVSVGLVALMGWRGNSSSYAAASAYVPISIHVAPSVLLHANVGRDWSRGFPATSRAGLSLEWQVVPEWSLIGERFRQSDENFTRVGLRWQATAALSVDLSRAAMDQSGANRWWTLGANWAFEFNPTSLRSPQSFAAPSELRRRGDRLANADGG